MAAKKGASASKTAIVPLGDRVLIQPQAEEETSPSGIILPETASKEKTDRGKVVAVGEGKLNDDGTRQPMSVKKGDTVLFSWGEKVEIDDEEYYLVSESNVLAVIK